MTYRTYKAQLAHETIIKYIKDVVSEKTVIQVVNKLSFATLTKTSINGHSHLIDAIHLSSVMTDVKVSEKINFLIDTILKRAQSVGKEAVLFLLKTPCSSGYTPLNSLLNQANKENLDKFLTAIHYFVDKRHLAYQDYQDLLFFKSQQGMTAFHILLRRENREIFQAYLDEIHDGIHQGRVSVLEYVNFFLLLSQPSTILHYANLIHSSNSDLLIEELNYLIEQEWLTTEKFCEFIMARDANGFTLLHSITKENNGAILKSLLTQLKKAAESQRLKTEKLADILLAKTPRGFSIIHLAVSNKHEVAIEILAFLNECVQSKLITKRDFQSLYMQRNQTGFTFFASAIKTDKLKIVKLFISTIQQAVANHWLSFSLCRKLFFQASNIGTTPLHIALEHGNSEVIKEYFLALKEGLSKGYFKEIDIELLFQKSANNSHTPLYEVVQSNSLPRVKLLLEQLKSLCSTKTYLTILNQKVEGELVRCQGIKGAEKINALLKREREDQPDYQSSSSSTYSSDRFFKPKLYKTNLIQKAITDITPENLTKVEDHSGLSVSKGGVR
ncbi:hypothetical protein ACQUW5_05795 [Legionella sp. CNM-1927-20]|uniref:hypothetical protein n=1 Tax=Legionella sp. CNM-1927-20 TaxID=3422221 RepID=UPI00403B22E4